MTNEPKSDQTVHRSRARVATAAIAAGLTVVLVLVSRVIAGGTVGTALPPDFPVAPGFPEGNYLKLAIAIRVP